ncbi:hypothetical protein N7478_005983 [Penicillium angulare]|uniref:uncharacterized protein n=1 Tax=Penicillium angulare TaxID=116970 RepID=UPI00254003BA|nr:uncharacterized protein N7478_005983 [Penicillium angulare]KAJ5280611.1 hypothetical protein N7478_005983 [Penicillium angulare]
MSDKAGLKPRYGLDYSRDPAKDIVALFGLDNNHPAKVLARHNSSLLDEAPDLVALEPKRTISLYVSSDPCDNNENLIIDQAIDTKYLTQNEENTRVDEKEMSSELLWRMAGASPFSSIKELVQAGKNTSRLWKVPMEDNLLLNYGIRYIPSHEASAPTQRTVIIEGFPSDSTLTEVLSWVRGGQVFAASLMNTTPITGYESAMVTFLTGESTLRFAEMIVNETDTSLPEGVTVRFLETPTYPISGKLQKTIEDKKATRCLLLQGRIEEAHQAFWKLKKKLPCKQYVDCIAKKKQRVFHFPSIKLALWAYEELCKDSEFGPESVCFHADPCSDPTTTSAFSNS